MRYRPGLPLALRDVSVGIAGGSKVGVVGRTGAGKSSLLALVFRLVEAAARGAVLIDGRDVGALGLRALRSAIVVIPQDPILLEGSVATNLDPFGAAAGEGGGGPGRAQLRAALRKASLPDDDAFLEKRVEKHGRNFSAGERQLLCFARALLKKAGRRARILIMDEPTASVDGATDAAVQRMVRREFADCTVVTIAHRLATVMDSDKILVMHRGRAVEYAPPAELLCDPQSRFARMVAASPVGQQGLSQGTQH